MARTQDRSLLHVAPRGMLQPLLCSAASCAINVSTALPSSVRLLSVAASFASQEENQLFKMLLQERQPLQSGQLPPSQGPPASAPQQD